MCVFEGCIDSKADVAVDVLKVTEACEFLLIFSKPGVLISSSTLRDGGLPRVGETGDCSGVVERALCDRGVKKRASGDDDIGEELNRLLK